MALDVNSIWRRYWTAYGGTRAIFTSVYFWIAIFLTVLGYNFWSEPDWWEVPLSVLPNLLGFSLSGFAILLGVIQPKYFSILSQKNAGSTVSIMSEFTATFTHFVLVQASALLSAIVLKSTVLFFACKTELGPLELQNGWGELVFQTLSLIGWFLFIYAVMLVFATSIEVFRISQILQVLASHFDEPNNEP